MRTVPIEKVKTGRVKKVRSNAAKIGEGKKRHRLH